MSWRPAPFRSPWILAYDAFEFAQKYRCLVLILTDGMQGQIMEAV